jgi:hypothetical protein
MKQPTYTGCSDLNERVFREWALENAKRADRLLAAAKHVCLFSHNDWVPGIDALESAALDYEDQVG